MSASDIEKKSLEAHVELCAARYSNLEDRFDEVDRRIEGINAKIDSKIGKMEHMLETIATKLDHVQESRNAQLIKWGTAIIAVLFAGLAGVLWELIHVNK